MNFLNDYEYVSAAPRNWMNEEKNICIWPKNLKIERKAINLSMKPEEDWNELKNITIVGHYVTISEVLYIFNALSLVGLHATSLPLQGQAKFTFGSLLDAAIPNISSINSSSSKCDTLKNFFGLSYEQMQSKNSTNVNDVFIDLVTKNGNVKYNMTAAKRLYRVMRNATQVVILIHGFMESSDGLMVQGIAPEFLKKQGHKIFALDGKKIFRFEYFSSSTYARFMGERLGILLSQIIELGQDPKKIMLIGHSLGAHIAGVAGKQVQQLTAQPISRIVGLDPAAPCFSHVDAAGKLDRTDAAYVDVIHTNAGMLGLQQPVGHKDFYPNGGESQPGCYLYTCHHSRAWELFAESLNAPDVFPARKCENFKMFQEGRCSNHDVARMGIASELGSPGTYFLSTGPSMPFGLGPAGSG